MGVIPQPPPPRRRPMVEDCRAKPIFTKCLAETWKCSHCESLVSEDRERCFNCGAPVTEENRGEVLKDSKFVEVIYG